MVYTQEEKRRMDRLLAAFGDFVAQSDEIDVAYSDKSGYVRLIVADCADSIFFNYTDYDDMLRTFIFDATNCMMDRLRKGPGGRLSCTTTALQEARRYIRDILETLEEDAPYALEVLDKTMELWKKEHMRLL